MFWFPGSRRFLSPQEELGVTWVSRGTFWVYSIDFEGFQSSLSLLARQNPSIGTIVTIVFGSCNIQKCNSFYGFQNVLNVLELFHDELEACG